MPNARHDYVLCLLVELKQAQPALTFLRERGWVDEKYKVGRIDKNGEKDYAAGNSAQVLIPILEECREQVENAHLGALGMEELELLPVRSGSLKAKLEGVLTEKEYAHLLSSFDVLGDIAMLEIPAELQEKEKAIAKAVMELYPHVRTVVKKEEGTGGPFRIRPVKVIMGEKRTRTVSKENGCSLIVDLNKAYYNPRMASERMRIVEQMGKDEKVLVLFAGVGPYAVLAEKMAGAKGAKNGAHKPGLPAKIIAIELNPDAVEMMKENVKLNKCKRIEVVEGDVEKVLREPKYRNCADRIIMPHPTESMQFLPVTLLAAKKGCVIHLYAFGPAEEPLPPLLKEAQELAQKEGRTLVLQGWRVVQTYSPTLVQVVMDLQVG